MIKSYNLILIGVFVLAFCLFGFTFFYLQQSYDETNLSSNLFQQKNNSKNYKNKELAQEKVTLVHDPEIDQELPIKFIFRMRSKRLLKPNIKKIPSSVEAHGEPLLNWSISNFLNLWYPEWKEYFYITEETQQKDIVQKNYITYQPKRTAILMQTRDQIDLADLAALNIDHQNIEITAEKINKFLTYLQNEQNSLEEIKRKIVEEFPASNVKSVTEKIVESVYFY